jgi:hypothetical protein
MRGPVRPPAAIVFCPCGESRAGALSSSIDRDRSALMSVRAAVLLVPGLLALTVGAGAAPFDNLKEDLSSCLRFELDGTRSQRHVPMTAKAGLALQKCAGEMDRLERADPRRLRSDHGLSPSTWAVIDSVFGPGSRGRLADILYRAGD